jgi:hypothetical protein
MLDCCCFHFINCNSCCTYISLDLTASQISIKKRGGQGKFEESAVRAEEEGSEKDWEDGRKVFDEV